MVLEKNSENIKMARKVVDLGVFWGRGSQEPLLIMNFRVLAGFQYGFCFSPPG